MNKQKIHDVVQAVFSITPNIPDDEDAAKDVAHWDWRSAQHDPVATVTSFPNVWAEVATLAKALAKDFTYAIGGEGAVTNFGHQKSVTVPEPARFDSPMWYNAAVLHELVHATGAMNGTIHRENYNLEEIVTESVVGILLDEWEQNTPEYQEYSRDYTAGWASGPDHSLPEFVRMILHAAVWKETYSDKSVVAAAIESRYNAVKSLINRSS